MALTCDEITALIGQDQRPSKVRLTTAEMAEDAFVKAEHVKMLEMMNTPTDYDARKKAFIELAEAREAATLAQLKLRQRVERP